MQQTEAKINHNVVWTLINSAKRITREVNEGKYIEHEQIEELRNTINTLSLVLKEGNNDTGR